MQDRTFLCVFFCFTLAFLRVSYAVSPVNLNAGKINGLRKRLTHFRSMGDDVSMLRCREAIIQLTNGFQQSNVSDLRYECFVQAAESEHREGRYRNAIARCSDILYELPSARAKLNRVVARKIAKVKFLRGKCFSDIKLHEFAVVDITESFPDLEINDQKVAESMLGGFSSADSMRKRKAKFDSRTRERMGDFIEQCVLNHPCTYFTDDAINELISLPTPLKIPTGKEPALKIAAANQQHSSSSYDPIVTMAGSLLGFDSAAISKVKVIFRLLASARIAAWRGKTLFINALMLYWAFRGVVLLYTSHFQRNVL
jgi:hypothetical protein